MAHILKRFASLIIILLGITFFSYCLVFLAPGSPAEIKLSADGQIPTQASIKQTEHEMGLDRPLMVQYVSWLKNILHGDFGKSYQKNREVKTEVLRYLPNTLKLTAFSLLIMCLIAFPLGIFSALYSNRLLDRLVRFFASIANSLPNFCIGLGILYLLGYRINVFKVIGNGDFSHYVMPALTLGISLSGMYTFQIRAAVLEELSKDYVTALYTRGIKKSVIIVRHVLKNALLSITTLLGMSIGHMLGGAAVVETIFVLPGLGTTALTAINNRDIPIIQAFVIWMAIIYLTINLAVDLLYVCINPQIRLQKGIKL